MDLISGVLEVEKHDDVEIQSELFADETVITAMVDQYVVKVVVKANVIGMNATNTTVTTPLTVPDVSFPLDKNTSAADVLAAITASGAESDALSTWDTYYNVGETYYNRTVTITDAEGNTIDTLGALTEDIAYLHSQDR